ncbi:MAG: CDP-alcohol phosphatidyltransferase family protein [Chloroflexi bacterium]|nr:CDP-alcohol phosphatidyltransferase family protein [Chloroflexota bacterium]
MTKLYTKIDRSSVKPIGDRISARIVPHVPARVSPNQVSWIGFGFLAVAALSLYLASFFRAWLFVAALMFFLHWVADYVDGDLARARGLSSQRGFFLDIFLDFLGYTLAAVGLLFASYTQPRLIALWGLLNLFQPILILFWILLRQTFPTPKLGSGETVAVVIVLCVLTFYWDGPALTLGGQPLGWFDLAALGVVLVSSVELVGSAVKLYRSLDPREGGSS